MNLSGLKLNSVLIALFFLHCINVVFAMDVEQHQKQSCDRIGSFDDLPDSKRSSNDLDKLYVEKLKVCKNLISDRDPTSFLSVLPREINQHILHLIDHEIQEEYLFIHFKTQILPRGTNAALYFALQNIDNSKIAHRVPELLKADDLEVNYQAECGISLLNKALFTKRNDVALTLLQKGANACAMDRLGQTPLHSAARNNNVEGIELLLRHSVPVDILNGEKLTPLTATAAPAHVEAATVLLAHGANAHAMFGGMSLLHCLADGYIKTEQARRYIQLLKRYGGNINSKNAPDGLTPLHYCVTNGKRKTAIAFLQEDADVNLQNHQGETPLMYAIHFGRSKMLRLLLEYRAHIEKEKILTYLETFGCRSPVSLSSSDMNEVKKEMIQIVESACK